MTDAQIELSSLRPYLIRAHHEWMSDNDLTPHLVVNAEREGESERDRRLRLEDAWITAQVILQPLNFSEQASN